MNHDEVTATTQATDKEAQEADTGQLIRLNDHYSYDPQLNTIALTSSLEGLDHENLDRLAQTFADRENTQGWTVIWDYAATGEGHQIYYLRSSASSEAEARDHFRARFFEDADDQHWEWVLIGLEVHSGAFWPEYLTGFRMPPDELELHWQSRL